MLNLSPLKGVRRFFVLFLTLTASQSVVRMFSFSLCWMIPDGGLVLAGLVETSGLATLW